MKEPILTVDGLSKQFAGTSVLRDICFTVKQAKTLGIVGESGSGKTTLVRCLLRAIDPDSGTIRFRGRTGSHNLEQLSARELLPLRRELQMIFQDPFASLNPRMTIAQILEEPLIIHEMGNKSDRRAKVINMLERVQLDASALNRYPHAFSGGQRQRVGIARALILEPSLVVCDESVAALDVSVQAQILDLLSELQNEMGLTYLFVAHDLSVVRHFCDDVLVLHDGEIVESGDVAETFSQPKHNYTKLLLSAVPSIDPDVKLAPLTRTELGLPEITR
ncbi:MAG: ATP-binding cassette domain-containing protein [Pseudomonadales bacterium]|nr:ATP-binding cassette domain-containing protein [Pseudomonadales bacterium]